MRERCRSGGLSVSGVHQEENKLFGRRRTAVKLLDFFFLLGEKEEDNSSGSDLSVPSYFVSISRDKQDTFSSPSFCAR